MQRIAAIFVGLVLLFFLLIMGTAIFTYPGLIKISQTADAQWIEVQKLDRQRAGLVTNLAGIITTKGGLEKSAVASAIEACDAAEKIKIERDQVTHDSTELVNYEKAQAKISAGLSALKALCENLPPVKAGGDFAALKVQLADNADLIADARTKYNEDVKLYNARIASFPTRLITSSLGFPEKPLFNAVKP